MKVVCASLPGPGHAHPMLAVARALGSRGHDVTVATGAEHVEDAARAGAEFEPLPITPGSAQASLRPYEDAERMAVELAPRMAALGPDAVVADLITLAGGLAAEMSGIPYATLSIHALHTPSGELPPFGWGAPPGRFLGRLRDEWMRRGNIRDLVRARTELNTTRARLGLPAVERLDGQLSDRLILVATLPSLEVPRADWPPRAHVVGPCLWDAGGDPPDLPPGEGPLVLVAASTAHDQGALVRAAIDACVGAGARAIVTTGRSDPPASVPAGVAVARFASHDAILGDCDAVICNGGHGIVARALSHGVPLVVVPGHGDQRENAYRVARAGAGIGVRKMGALPRALRGVLTEERYREGARRAREEAAGLDGPARAAELLEALAAPVDAS